MTFAFSHFLDWLLRIKEKYITAKAASSTPPNIKIKVVTICSPISISKNSLFRIQRLICSPKTRRGICRQTSPTARSAAEEAAPIRSEWKGETGSTRTGQSHFPWPPASLFTCACQAEAARLTIRQPFYFDCAVLTGVIPPRTSALQKSMPYEATSLCRSRRRYRDIHAIDHRLDHFGRQRNRKVQHGVEVAFPKTSASRAGAAMDVPWFSGAS